MAYRLARFEGVLLREGDGLFLAGGCPSKAGAGAWSSRRVYRLALDSPRIVDHDRQVVVVLDRLSGLSDGGGLIVRPAGAPGRTVLKPPERADGVAARA